MNITDFFGSTQNMSVEQAHDFISEHKESEYQLLDVRQPREYEARHIPGSISIPLPQLPDRVNELDLTKPVLIY